MQHVFIPIDKPLNSIWTTIQFHLGQTPVNLASTCSPSKGSTWTTRSRAPLLMLPKWTGCLEMAIATTAITASPTIPRVRPWSSHCLFSLGHKLHNLLISLFPRRTSRYRLKSSSGMAAFKGIAWNTEPLKPAFAWFLSLGISLNDSKLSITWL